MAWRELRIALAATAVTFLHNIGLGCVLGAVWTTTAAPLCGLGRRRGLAGCGSLRIAPAAFARASLGSGRAFFGFLLALPHSTENALSARNRGQ